MKLNSELRAQARQELAGNWTQPVLATLVYFFVAVALGLTVGLIPFVGSIIANLFGVMPLAYGLMLIFLAFIRGEKAFSMSKLFDGFQDYGRTLTIVLLTAAYTFLWMLLFIVPGIIKSYSYSMTYYITKDKPELSTEEAINESMRLMEGNKMRLFLLDLSFIGWVLLSFLTCCIGLLWLIPYAQTARACFYEDLIANDTQKAEPAANDAQNEEPVAKLRIVRP